MLNCEGVALAAVAAGMETPVYVYSEAEILRRANAYTEAVGKLGYRDGEALVCYAVKANGNPVILRRLGEAGLGTDVTSGGELFLARNAGIDPARIVYSGVGKLPHEIRRALEAGIRALHVESEAELSAIAEQASELGSPAPVAIRVNPNIDAQTHPYISTGLHAHKFGVPGGRAVSMLREAQASSWLRPVGIAAHIGSQITELSPYAEAVAFLVDLATLLRAEGIDIEYIDVGGGLGILYDRPAPAIADWVTTVGTAVRQAGFDLVLEPGRSIVGPAGALLTRVVYSKVQGSKRFLIVDAGMTDLLRPALYQSYHPILPVTVPAGAPLSVADVVGPICETSDWLARDRELPEANSGDLLAIMQAGAYGYAMSSNYNGHLRPAEVLVSGDRYAVIRERQAYVDLLAGVPEGAV